MVIHLSDMLLQDGRVETREIVFEQEVITCSLAVEKLIPETDYDFAKNLYGIDSEGKEISSVLNPVTVHHAISWAVPIAVSPFSHAEMVRLVTPIFVAICSCVNLADTLAPASVTLLAICSPPSDIHVQRIVSLTTRNILRLT